MNVLTPSQYLLASSREYAIYVCRNRAIPFVGDGLKHGQMIALWVLRSRAEKLRTFALSGLMAYERLYVHGEASANEMIGLMAAPYKNNVPLIEGLGHFGSRVAPDAIGAPRYTDVRRAKSAEALLYHDLELIELEDNYDGSNKQPKHFLPLIPLVLLNGISGIAIGWSTNILPRNLKSLIEATKLALQDKPIDIIPPCYDRYNISVQSIGVNRWEFSGRAKVVDENMIHITELPPGLDIETFRKRLIDMEDKKMIHSFIDRSTESIDITVKMIRRAAFTEIVDGETLHYKAQPPIAADWSETKIIEYFKLRERVTERIVVIDWNGNAIQTYETAEQLVQDFAQWRLGWYTKRFEHYRCRDQYELQYWLAVQMLFKSNFTKKLGTFANRAAMQEEIAGILQPERVVDQHQMDRLLSMATYRWTTEFEAEVTQTIVELQTATKDYESILASPKKLRDVYIKELDEALKAMK